MIAIKIDAIDKKSEKIYEGLKQSISITNKNLKIKINIFNKR